MFMKEILETIFDNRQNKEELIATIHADPSQFLESIRIALSDKQPYAWRAAWILGHCVHKDDPRIRDHITGFITALHNKKDGHQRELLKILMKMDLNETQEGLLFDECMNIWESLGKSPSVRIAAFRILIKIADKYPDLHKEIMFLTESQYLEYLSPGIKRSVEKMWKNK